MSYSVLASDSWKLTEQELKACAYGFDPETDLYAFIIAQSRIEDDSLLICIYSGNYLIFLPHCAETIDSSVLKNQIVINEDVILLDDNIQGFDLSLLHPARFMVLQNEFQKYNIIELYNFSYTTVGGYYAYFVIKTDNRGKIQEYFSFIYKKEPISEHLLIDKIKEKYTQ